MTAKHVAVFALLTIAATGCCMPGTYVKKNPGKWDKGVRYYRPKPYLLVTPSGETKLNDKGQPASVSPTDRYVNIELKYLPDFSEEYSLRVIPGIGSAEVSVTLQDGWNLTSINQKLDTQLDENVNAVANLLGKVAPGGLVGTSAREAMTVSIGARNVPLGFYESVIGEDSCGRKQIYGWRYLGFAPFNTCPTYATGACMANCEDGSLQLYGLVFENDVMVFKPLYDIAMISSHEASRRPVAAAEDPSEVMGGLSPVLESALIQDISSELGIETTQVAVIIEDEVAKITLKNIEASKRPAAKAAAETVTRMTARGAGMRIVNTEIKFEE